MPPPPAVSIVLWPSQMVKFPAIVAVGNGFTTTRTLLVLLQPLSVTVTVYVVFVTGFTVMLSIAPPGGLLHE